MASLSDAEKLHFLVIVLKHLDLSSLDYKPIAIELGINTPNNAQRRFKSIVESARFSLVDKQVVGRGGPPAVSDTAPATPRAKRTPKAKKAKKEDDVNGDAKAPNSAKKRKIEEMKEEETKLDRTAENGVDEV